MQVSAASDGHCVWYGQCPTGDVTLNCYYDGPAKPLSADAAKILSDLCPMLNINLSKCALLLSDELVCEVVSCRMYFVFQ